MVRPVVVSHVAFAFRAFPEARVKDCIGVSIAPLILGIRGFVVEEKSASVSSDARMISKNAIEHLHKR